MFAVVVVVVVVVATPPIAAARVLHVYGSGVGGGGNCVRAYGGHSKPWVFRGFFAEDA